MAKPKRSRKVKTRRTAPDWKALVETLGPCPKVPPNLTGRKLEVAAKAKAEWQRQLRVVIELQLKRRGRVNDPEWCQEFHSPTIEIAVDDPEATRKVRRNITRCRQSDAFRHNRLSGMQRDAEKEMEFAFRQRTVGLGAASPKYGMQRGGTTRADLGSSVEESWREWARLAIPRRVMIGAVIDVLVEPLTLADVERKHRMRRGQAFDNYVLALDLWAEVRGWIRGPRMDGGPHLMPEGVTS